MSDKSKLLMPFLFFSIGGAGWRVACLTMSQQHPLWRMYSLLNVNPD